MRHNFRVLGNAEEIPVGSKIVMQLTHLPGQ
jgi:hypothetical protein